MDTKNGYRASHSRNFKIFLALRVGDKEIVVGENTGKQSERCMCGFCETNEAFALYSDVAVSDDYLASDINEKLELLN